MTQGEVAPKTGPRLQAAWQRVRTDRLTQARVLLWTAMIGHAVLLVVMARGWFFTGDDWDYLTRDGLGNILEPHNGHITAIIAGLAVIAREVGGLDYWPLYPLIISVVWPAVAYASWWSWRRSGIEPMPAAIGGVLVAWLVTGAYMQFGHIAMAFTLASLIVAVQIDGEELTPRKGIASFGLSLVAVLSGSSGVVVTAVRGTLALGYRKWVGVVGAFPALGVYGLIRVLVGSDKELSFAFGPGDLVDIFRIITHLVGIGLRWVFFLPIRLQGASVVLLIIAAVLVLVWSRFSYRAMVWILSGSAFVFTVAVVRFLHSPDKMEALFAGSNDGQFLSVRYANMPVVLLVVAALPLVLRWSRAGRSTLKQSLLVAAVVLLVIVGVFQTATMFGKISNKSIVKAEQAASIVPLVEDGEPIVRPERLAGTANGMSFRLFALEVFAEEDLAAGILESDIYLVRDTPGISEEWGRGLLRLAVSRRGPADSWAQVGRPELKGCVPVDDAFTMQVTESVRFEIVVPDDDTQRYPAEVVWEDEFGIGRLRLGARAFESRERLFVVTAAPLENSPPATVTVIALNAEICFKR